MKQWKIKLSITALTIMLLTGCGSKLELKKSGFYLGHIFEAQIKLKKEKKLAKKSQKIMNDAFKKVIDLDTNLNELSTISEISALNAYGGLRNIEVSEETYKLIKKGITGSILTDGYFDVSWRPLTDLYKGNQFPAMAKIETAKKSIGYLNVQLDKNFYKIKFSNNKTKIGLDRIKRGYAVDIIVSELKKLKPLSGYVKTDNAVFYFGNKTEKITLADKEYKLKLDNRALYAIDIAKDEFLANSSLWSKYLPLEITEQNIQKIVVIAPNAVTAEVLANAFYFMGTEKSFKLISDLKQKVETPKLYDVFFVLEKEGEKIVSSSYN